MKKEGQCRIEINATTLARELGLPEGNIKCPARCPGEENCVFERQRGRLFYVRQTGTTKVASQTEKFYRRAEKSLAIMESR